VKVKDVMTEKVATVGQDATPKQVAGILAQRGISGIPVVDGDGYVLGVVSEADIIVNVASRPESAGVFGRLLRPEGIDERHLAATAAGDAMSPAWEHDDRAKRALRARSRQ
jgi:CBS domain-containing protein